MSAEIPPSPPGPVESQIERRRGRTEKVGQELSGGGQLGVAVGVGLHDCRVHPHRGVVDEDPVADRREVDTPLHRIAVGGQRRRHVRPVEPEVEREVVACSGRHTDEGQVMTPGHVGDQCLRPVAPGHPDHVGTVVDSLLGERT